MNEFQATAVMIGLFALRCIVPLVLTVGFVNLMNRLLERWAAEERVPQIGASPPMSAPVSQTTIPVAPAAPAPSIACWLLKNCDEQKRAQCAAYRRQGIPCWQARLIEEGRLPDGCANCPQYGALQGAI